MTYQITEVWKQPNDPNFSITTTLSVRVEYSCIESAGLIVKKKHYSTVTEEHFPIPLTQVGELLVSKPTFEKKGSISFLNTAGKSMELGNKYGHYKIANVDVAWKYKEDLEAIVRYFEARGAKIWIL